MTDPEALTPAQRVKALRTRLGLTQRGMEEHYGIPRPTIQSWEIGTRTPPEYAIRLLEAIVEYEKKS